jgi:hypothetical protein
VIWWKRKLDEIHADTSGQEEIEKSRQLLEEAKALSPKVEQYSESLLQHNERNHFVRRIELAYGLVGKEER